MQVVSFSCQHKYYHSKLYTALNSHMQNNNLSKKKKKKVPRVLDNQKLLLLQRNNATSLTSTMLHHSHEHLLWKTPYRDIFLRLSGFWCCLPCSLCLAHQGGGSLVFPPSPLPTSSTPLPVLTTQKATALPKLSLLKKDKLKKKEWVVAEKHLLNFGKSIRRKDWWSDIHKYQAHSSYSPSQIVSLLLDQLLIIHFSSNLELVLHGSWHYYLSHGSALFDWIILIQVVILVERNQAWEMTAAKQSEKQKVTRVTDSEEEDVSSPFLSNTGPSEQPINNPPQEEHADESLSRKHQALEEISINAKHPWATRAAQPSVAEVSESYNPCYRAHSCCVVEASAGGDEGKENRGQRASTQLRKCWVL